MRIFAKNKMAKHNELGKEGENAAAEYLMSKGYSIRHRNWHSGKRELDIVAQKDGELIVVVGCLHHIGGYRYYRLCR